MPIRHRRTAAALCATTLAAAVASVATAGAAGAATPVAGSGLLITAKQTAGYTALGQPLAVKLPAKAAACSAVPPKGSSELLALFEKGKPSAKGGSLLVEALVRTPSTAAAHALLTGGEAAVKKCGTASQTLGDSTASGKTTLHGAPAIAGSAGGVLEVIDISSKQTKNGVTAIVKGQLKALVYQAGKNLVIVTATSFKAVESGKSLTLSYTTAAAETAAASSAAKAAVADALKG